MLKITKFYFKVVSINSQSYAKASYMRVKDVEIEIKNPGSVLKGDTATAIINDINFFVIMHSSLR